MSVPRREMRRSGKIYHLTMTAVMAAVICVLSPLVIPIGPVPITLANLAMYLSLYLLGGKRGTASCLVYVLIGMAGVPVFAGFTGGAAKLFGPTGGYIVGYLLMVMIAGAVIDRTKSRWMHGLGMVLGTALWYCISMDSTVETALTLCVIPFIPGDLVKMAVAMTVGPMLRDRLNKAGLG